MKGNSLWNPNWCKTEGVGQVGWNFSTKTFFSMKNADLATPKHFASSCLFHQLVHLKKKHFKNNLKHLVLTHSKWKISISSWNYFSFQNFLHFYFQKFQKHEKDVKSQNQTFHWTRNICIYIYFLSLQKFQIMSFACRCKIIFYLHFQNCQQTEKSVFCTPLLEDPVTLPLISY